MVSVLQRSHFTLLIFECLACDAYHLPTHIAPHVDFVTPSVHFDAKLTRRDSTQPARSIGQPGMGIGPKTTGRFEAAVPTEIGRASCRERVFLSV